MRGVRPGAALAAALAAASSGCAATPAGAPPPTALGAAVIDEVPVLFEPAGRAARQYGVALFSVPFDALRGPLAAEVGRAAAALRRPPPVSDVRLDAAANDMARAADGKNPPGFELIDFLLGHYGIVEPAPRLVFAVDPSSRDEAIRAAVGGQIAAALAEGRPARLGIGIHRRPDGLVVVIALQERNVTLLPLPRRLAAGGAADVAGELGPGFRKPQVFVTRPDGAVAELKIYIARAGNFLVQLKCERGQGRYQVEVMAEDAMGPTVVANFPVYCGVDPPLGVARTVARASTPREPPAAEQALFALVNKDRAVAHLLPLVWDAALGGIARAHSREMADGNWVGHVSPRTGNAYDRVTRAGLKPAVVFENVGRAASPEEAEHGFMQSPGHRANVLDAAATRGAVGVAFAATGPERLDALYVTQLFVGDKAPPPR